MSLSEISERAKRYQSDLLAFTDSHVYPAESVYDEQMHASLFRKGVAVDD
jgi:acyl-CoA dehydrogenase